MLDSLIRFSLSNRLLIAALAVVLLVVGGWQITRLPIDVFPDLNRPRVVVLTEAAGLAPEEVERLVTIPLESALNGATGIIAVRSSSGVGLSVIYVEFDWGTDIYTDRQIVTERLELASSRMPADVQPQLAPISSLMGQIMLVGLTIDEGAETDSGKPTSLLKLRELADWVVRRRLLTIPGVAQVFTMGGEGGGQRQVQVRVDPNELRRTGITLHQVEEAVAASNENATGGYLVQGARESLVRSLGRIESIDDLNSLVVDGRRDPPTLLKEVARVVDGPEIPRGTASVTAQPGVILTIAKQPGADTRRLTADIFAAFKEIEQSLPADVIVEPELYRLDTFIERSIDNVLEALRDGAVLVVIVLFVFLLNFRTTFITLTAIPLSLVITGLVFTWFDLSINTMTLGGLAVAIGELVDDAIVDVENIFRRLRENRLSENPRSPLRVVYAASIEVRSSIVFATILVVLVFIPLFSLGGLPGRLFTPLAIAYIVSILASLLVSLTVTPVMSYWLLPNSKVMESEKDGLLLRMLKVAGGSVIRFSLRYRALVLSVVAAAAVLSVVIVLNMGRDFLPPFNEGSVIVSLILPPGTSLNESDRIGTQAEKSLKTLDDVLQISRRTGRAELDEHAEGVNVSELILVLDPTSSRTRQQQLADIRDLLDKIPGIESSSGRSTTEQPLAHLISHMLSGTKAQIAIKIYGENLDELRRLGGEVRDRLGDLVESEDIVDLRVEPQVLIPQLQIKLDREKLALRGLTPRAVNHVVETAMNGRVVSRYLEGEASFDIVVRFDEPYRKDMESLKQTAITLPSGGTIPLEDVADILPDRMGPNTIKRENARRRIVVSCNISDRALSEMRDEIRSRLTPLAVELRQLGPGYFIEYGGQFESEEAATRLMGWLSLLSLAGMFLVLYTLFKSVNLVLQVMAVLPMAAIGAVAALLLSGQSLSVPSMVGFVSLAGIASRNGILLITHYLHLVRHEGEAFTQEMVVRAGQERLAPVLMTALTSGIGLVPIVLAGNEPGKEILYPVAIIIVGGLISSTLLEFFVHPALFWTFGRKSAEQLTAETTLDLGDEPA